MNCLKCKDPMTKKEYDFGVIFLCLNSDCDEPDTVFSEDAIKNLEILDYKELEDNKGFFIRTEPEPQIFDLNEEESKDLLKKLIEYDKKREEDEE